MEANMRLLALCLCALLLTPSQATLAQGAEPPLRVAVATNFAATLELLVERYGRETGESITISSASTGALYTQVVHGAPFDLLLAADSERPARLVREGFTLGPARTYALGQLVLAYQPELDSLAQQGIESLLSRPGLNLALANAELAPYGLAAEAVLSRIPMAAPRRLTGNNVGQAMQMWVSGGADLAFVAASFRPAQFLEIPSSWYPAINQQAVVLAGTRQPDRAQAFLDWLTGPVAISAIRAQGYSSEAPQDG